SVNIYRGKSRLSRRKRSVCGYGLLVKIDNSVTVRREHAHGARSKVEVISFGAGLVSPPADLKVQSQVIHDRAGDFVLNGKDVFHLLLILVGPERKVVAH